MIRQRAENALETPEMNQSIFDEPLPELRGPQPRHGLY